MKAKRFILAALVLGMASTMAHADLHEVKENIKHDSKEAATKTGHESFGLLDRICRASNSRIAPMQYASFAFLFILL